MKKALSFLSLVAGSIMVASAQIAVPVVSTTGQVNGSALFGLLATAQTLVGRLVPFAVGVAVLAFFWYLIQFVWHGQENAEAKKISLKGMGYSVLALFIMVSIWGIVGALGSMLGIGQGGSVPIPGVPVPAN